MTKNIVKKQHEFLRVKKASIKFDEAVLMLDFAENYSFIVQDCAQSYYWNSAWAANHPFVLYHLNHETKKLAMLYFHISEMIHNTITIHAFLKTLINK